MSKDYYYEDLSARFKVLEAENKRLKEGVRVPKYLSRENLDTLWLQMDLPGKDIKKYYLLFIELFTQEALKDGN